jgi:hypothetical protein
MDNVPEPLGRPPIPLLGSSTQQLSFGERAALEGVLVQLRPKVSIEIGSAEGGTLERIARRSVRVHSFDRVLPAPEVVQLPNVTLHTGDTRVTLGPLMEHLHTDVDFAFIDGDHTAAGVREDLNVLLDCGRCARTVILLHDLANAEVRAGVEDALDRRHGIYVELDFLPGYTFARGVFAGERWGGLGLLVTGEGRAGRTQDLYRPI